MFEKARLAATRDLDEAGELVLAPEAQREFVELLLGPPAPTAALTKALKEVRARRRR